MVLSKNKFEKSLHFLCFATRMGAIQKMYFFVSFCQNPSFVQQIQQMKFAKNANFSLFLTCLCRCMIIQRSKDAVERVHKKEEKSRNAKVKKSVMNKEVRK